MLPSFAYARPRTLDEATRILRETRGVIHSGGTDLLGCVRDGVTTAGTVVSLGAIPELRGLTTRDGALVIGVMTTVTELAESEIVRTRFPGLAMAAREVASPQLRNQGTVGGNLCQKPRCWYYRGDFHCLRKGGETCFAFDGESQYHCIFGGDMCYIVHPSDIAPMLVALGAAVRIAGPAGVRTVAIEEFFVAPSVDPTRETVLEAGEIVIQVVVPEPGAGVRSRYRKVRTRAAWDFAVAGIALAVKLEAGRVAGARVVLAGAAPVPWRSQAAEQALVGMELSESTLEMASAAVTEGAEPLRHNGYKIPLFQGLLREELAAIGKIGEG